ncbi:hypothetical protein CEP52_012953 [Fusarium oligoseptatum]|uniref:Uncharacterized protein n=1 Tax=Fusarium oligoseptatum TaxID=2604345 RepID=A0A428SVS9_9HYPO|nr:hypothetical protein CEP52_012953 [Fusarium oligoseptatum]
MSDKSLSANETIDMMNNISTKLREAIIKSMPCAFEQYLTVSVPGQVLDTTVGGRQVPSFVSESLNRMSVDRHDEVRVNESRLVDAMVPLDKIMLGPTGKSVSRSYYTALDTLVPRKTDIGSTDIDLGAKPNKSTRYGQALDFLRSNVEVSQKRISEQKVKGAKKKVLQMGGTESLVEVHVAKQLAWAEARAKLDEARNQAVDARMNRADQQGSAEYSERQKNIRNAQAETHARWMDWVANGDKSRVDYAFALVDRDSIMARIEKAKEATRDAMVLAIDSTEWASVTLEPKNWAYLCRAKVLDFKNRNPIDPDLLRMKLENLRRMKHAYSTYETSFKDGENEGLAQLQKGVTEWQETVTRLKLKIDQAKAAEKQAQEDRLKRQLQENTGTSGVPPTGDASATPVLPTGEKTEPPAQPTVSTEEGAPSTGSEPKSTQADEKDLGEATESLKLAQQALEAKKVEYTSNEKAADETLQETTAKALYA